jgi:hypothetical protein
MHGAFIIVYATPLPPLLLPLEFPEAKVNQIANQHQDSFTGTKAIPEPSSKPTRVQTKLLLQCRSHKDGRCATMDESSHILHFAVQFVIQASWTLWDMSDLDLPYQYWLDMTAFGVPITTLDFKAIQCSFKLFIIVLTFCVAIHSKPNCISWNISSWASCLERPMRILNVDCQWHPLLICCLPSPVGGGVWSYFVGLPPHG